MSLQDYVKGGRIFSAQIKLTRKDIDDSAWLKQKNIWDFYACCARFSSSEAAGL